jgi:hypothetical protein
MCEAAGVDPESVPDRSARKASRYISRQRPRSPDRAASRARRRMLGGSSSLPDTLRHHYTEGMRAVLTVIAGEVKRQGRCCLPIDQVAALAGVCRTTVQSTLHEARRLGHLTITKRPRPGQKSLTNVVEIASPEWRVWLTRGPRRIGSNPPVRPEISSTTRMEERLLGGMASRIGGAPSPRSSAWQLGRSAPMEGAGPSGGPGPSRYIHTPAFRQSGE